MKKLQTGGKFNRQNLVAIPCPVTRILKRDHGLDIELLDEPHIKGPVDGVIVNRTEAISEEWTALLEKCVEQGIPIYDATTLYEMASARVPVAYLNPEYELEISAKTKIYLTVKRVLDILFVILSLPITLPLSLLTALAVRLDSPGPVLFRQERIGKDGKPFTLYKFRSMRIDSEKYGARFAQENDGRVTRVGRIIRKLRLDELPQLWNVLRGDMAIIGPRPEQVKFAKEFEKQIPFYNMRHCVKPGITGWAQIKQGYAAGVEETMVKLEYDLYYIKNLSFWMDLKIATMTIYVMLRGVGSR